MAATCTVYLGATSRLADLYEFGLVQIRPLRFASMNDRMNEWMNEWKYQWPPVQWPSSSSSWLNKLTHPVTRVITRTLLSLSSSVRLILCPVWSILRDCHDDLIHEYAISSCCESLDARLQRLADWSKGLSTFKSLDRLKSSVGLPISQPGDYRLSRLLVKITSSSSPFLCATATPSLWR